MEASVLVGSCNEEEGHREVHLVELLEANPVEASHRREDEAVDPAAVEEAKIDLVGA